MANSTRLASALLFFLLTASPGYSAPTAAAQPQACPEHAVMRDGDLVVVDCHGKVTGSAASRPAPAATSPESAAAQMPMPTGAPGDQAAYQQWTAGQFRYAAWQQSYSQAVFDWQYKASIAIFFVVIGLVFAGVYFAWLQFRTTLYVARSLPTGAAQTTNGSDPVPAPSSPTEFKFGKDGFIIRSSYVGLIILAISMGFFFMYLKYVYTITPVGIPDAASAASQSR